MIDFSTLTDNELWRMVWAVIGSLPFGSRGNADDAVDELLRRATERAAANATLRAQVNLAAEMLYGLSTVIGKSAPEGCPYFQDEWLNWLEAQAALRETGGRP